MSSRYARSRITRCSPLSRESLKHAKDAVKANQLTAAPTAGDESVENENNWKQFIQDLKMARPKSSAPYRTRSSNRIRNKTKPTVEDSTVKLLDLPTEMLALVADFLDGKDLLQLRLAHSLLAAAADDAFARTFFTHRKHLFTNYSLEVLANICSRPNWARKLTSIEFCTAALDRFNPEYDTAAAHRTRAAIRRGEIYSKFEEETDGDFDKQHDSLVTIFETLEDLPRHLELTLTAGYNPKKLEGYFGLSQLIKRLGSEVTVNDLPTKDCNQALVAMTFAWDEAEYAPHGCDFFMCNLCLCTFNTLIEWDSASPRLWSTLTMLDLGLDHERHLWHAPHTSGLEAFFAGATNLTYLSLDFNNPTPVSVWPEANCIKWLVASTSQMKLDHLSLMGASTRIADITALANVHAATLRFLGLCAISVSDVECWSTAFSAFKVLDIDCLSINRLTTGSHEDLRLLVDSKREEEIEAKEKETVMKILDELSNDPQYIYIELY